MSEYTRTLYRKWSIKTRLLTAFAVMAFLFAGSSASFLYHTQKAEYLEGLDRKLQTSAALARAFMGDAHHNAISDAQSLSAQDYAALTGTLDKHAKEAGLSSLWSLMMLEDGQTVYTASSSLPDMQKEANQGGPRTLSFFFPRLDSLVLLEAKQAKHAILSSYENYWGAGRMIVSPHQDAQGRTYFIGASVSMDDLQSRLDQTALDAFFAFLLKLGIGLLVGVGLAQAIAAPIKELSMTARRMAEGNFYKAVQPEGGGAEVTELAKSFNVMREAVLDTYGSLSDMVRELEETRDELQRSHTEMEERVRLRTEDLRKLTQAVEQSPHMVIITDLDGRIEYVNQSFVETTGYTRQEAVGRNPRFLQSGDTPRNLYFQMWKSLAEKGLWRGELKDKTKDGDIFWASMTISKVFDDVGEATHYVAVHEDITARKNAESSIRAAKELAETASRAKSEMLANMSHELRTPLNAILGFSDTILQEVFGPLTNDRYREYVGDINASGAHLLELINDILDVSAIEAGKMTLVDEPVDLGGTISTCLRLISHRAADGDVTLELDLQDGRTWVMGDARRLKQALLNLISNAVKFTGKGGLVQVSLFEGNNGEIVLQVRDSGIGMSQEELEKSMERFGQADSGLARKYEGTGLGLPLTKGLIELHDGALMMETAPGKGVTAKLVLPNSRRLENPPIKKAAP